MGTLWSLFGFIAYESEHALRLTEEKSFIHPQKMRFIHARVRELPCD